MHRTLTLLDRTGDTTLLWDEASDAAVLPVIERKLVEGVTFFILEPVAGGLAPPRRTQLTDTAAIRDRRALAMADRDFAALVGLGDVTVVRTDEAPLAKRTSRTKISRDARAIAAGQSVAVRPARGG